MTTLDFDPNTARSYTTVTDSVAEEVSTAAQLAGTATTAMPSLGLIGADVLTAFQNAVARYSAALSGHASTIADHGGAVAIYRGTMTATDEDFGASLSGIEVR